MDYVPNDILLMILELLGPHEYAMLCRVSRRLQGFATKKLYQHLIIDLHSKRMLSCIRACSQSITTFTRAVTFVAEKFDPATKTLTMILVLSRAQNLESFQYFSWDPLDEVTLATIREFCPRIHSFRAPLGRADLPEFGQMISIDDIHVEYTLRQLFRYIENTARTTLESLRIGCAFKDSSKFGNHFQNLRQPCPNLQRFTLEGVDLAGLFWRIASVVPMNQLTHFAIWQCDNAEGFVSEWVQAQSTSQQLKHLAIFFPAYNGHVTSDHLETLFMHCQLESLQLTWARDCDATPIPELGASLRTLSLQSIERIAFDFGDVIAQFQRLRAVEELALSVPRIQLDLYDELKKLWPSLGNLPKLRTLYLTQRWPPEYEDFEETEDILCDQFAENFFAYMRHCCPLLQGLVIHRGHENTARMCYLRCTLQGGEWCQGKARGLLVRTETFFSSADRSGVLLSDPNVTAFGGKVGQFTEQYKYHGELCTERQRWTSL